MHPYRTPSDAPPPGREPPRAPQPSHDVVVALAILLVGLGGLVIGCLHAGHTAEAAFGALATLFGVHAVASALRAR